MSEDLAKSLSELDRMLKETLIEKPIAPHLDPNEGLQNAAEDCPYCIKNGSYLRISDDKMKAWIFLNTPAPGEDFYSYQTIMEFIREHGVIKGYHTSNITAIARKHVYNREILVAQGAYPVNGVDGYYEWMVDVNKRKTPLVREDGSVDYSYMAEVPSVQEGDVICKYHRAEIARDGYDVFGKISPAKPAKDIVPIRGRGISNEADPDVYVATMTGRVEYRDKHIDIKKVYEVKGDVDLVTGKVEFFGDVHIKGNVESGVIVRASRNVEIDGIVEAASIYAGGDITIKKGIQGGQKGKIVAKGNVNAEFIEHATVEAGGIIRANSFINANIDCGDIVMAEGKNGSIISGNVRGLLGVVATSIGNDAETKTTVMSGYTSDEYSRYIELYQAELDYQEKLSATVDEMSAILKRKRLTGEKVSGENDKKLLELNEKKDEYFDKLDKTRADKEALATVIEKGKGSMVLANEKIYRGVTVCVEGNRYQVPENTSYMRYRNVGGRVEGSVIVVT